MKQITDILTDDGRKPGLVPNMDRTEYLAIPRLNPSSLAAGLIGVDEVDPRRIRDAFQGEEKPRSAASQDSLDKGTLAHLALLQPEQIATRVAVWNGGRRAGAEYDGWCNDNADKLRIRKADHDETLAAVNQMRSQPMVAELLCDMEYEVAVFSETDGVFEKGQIDGLSISNRTILDIKTTSGGIDRRSVALTIAKFHYREKMAAYRAKIAAHTKTHPDEWRCWALFLGIGEYIGIRRVKFTTQSLEFGELRMKQAEAAVRECLDSGRWPMFQADDVAEVMPWEMADETGDIEYAT